MQRVTFHRFMRRLIKSGTLHVVDHLGNKRSYVGTLAPQVTIHIHNPKIYIKLLLNPDLALGEGYMHNDITIEDASVYDLLTLLASNLNPKIFPLSQKIYTWCQSAVKSFAMRIMPFNISKANVAHHYDLSPQLYALFLDQDQQYSCAYFQNKNDDLDTAQLNKKKHLAAKLNLQPGQRVLDIGCGWGGLALFLAKHYHVHVTGLTLSEEQLAVAKQRAIDAGLNDSVQFELQDYRKINGEFDRIVSVGMFEHVGLAQFKTYFQKIHALLADDGIALIHSIGSECVPGMISPWILKYIFPGGYIPTLAETLQVIHKLDLYLTDIEILHHHYAATLKAWRERFLANLDQLPPELDMIFVRMWEYYLAGSQVSFEKLGLMNFQIQLMKQKQYIPLTRDYIFEAEHGVRYRQAESMLI